MFTTKGYVRNVIGSRGFGFIRGFHGDVEIEIFVHEARIVEAGWTKQDFCADLEVEIECKRMSDGRYSAVKLHELNGTLAPAFYKMTVVDRQLDLTIVKVMDIKSSYAMGYRVLGKDQLAGSYPTLVAARQSIGRVIEPPRDVNHGKKTNMVVTTFTKDEKKKKAA